MGAPADPVKREQWRAKLRAAALASGLGHHPQQRDGTAMVQWNREHANDPAERARRSERAKASGCGKWMQGRTLSDEHRAAIGESAAVSYEERYGERADEERAKRRDGNRRRFVDVERRADVRPKHNGSWEYVEWRTAVFERDDFTCRDCGKRGGELHAHHVLTWADHPAERYVVDNGVTLCEDCHRARHRKVA